MTEHGDALDRLVRTAVEQARDCVRRLESPVSYHYDYPTLDRFESGQIRISHGRGPIDYAGLFGSRAATRRFASLDDVPALEELGRLAVTDENLRARLLAPGVTEVDDWATWFVSTSAKRMPLALLDRLANTVGIDFSAEDFEAHWQPLRNGLVWERLPVDIVVPVCLTTFETESAVQLSDRVRLEPLPEGEQRARMPQSIWNAAAHDCVAAAATHAVTLSNYEFSGAQRMLADYGQPGFYPLEGIELAFEALRVATAVPVGYAQIYMRPLGWAWRYTADLPPVIQGSMARRYPPAFDDYGWLRTPARVTAEEVARAAHALAELSAADRRLRLASQRFSSAALRSDEDDAILDLCIALEAALGDHQRSEMTYKLGMRAAAVLRQESGNDAARVRERVKLLYDWRSAVVHGGDVEPRRRRFAGGDGESSPLELAESLVRSVVDRLVRTEQLRTGEAIDAMLLRGCAADDPAASSPEPPS